MISFCLKAFFKQFVTALTTEILVNFISQLAIARDFARAYDRDSISKNILLFFKISVLCPLLLKICVQNVMMMLLLKLKHSLIPIH